MNLVQYDVAVVGASAAGSAVAMLARDRGLDVIVLEERGRTDLFRSRPPCVVPIWTLEAAWVPGGEVRAPWRRFRLVASGPTESSDAPQVVVEDSDCVAVDRARFSLSMMTRALAAGALLQDETRVLGLTGGGLATNRGTVRARYVIDASGLRGARLLGGVAVAPRDVAAVAHETRALADVDAARAFLERFGADWGDAIAFAAPCGPGSMIVARVDEERIALDATTMPGEGQPTARAALRRFIAAHPFAGGVLASDARLVPLSGPRTAVTCANVALVGEAAGTSRPGRGSGLALSVLSARMVVDAIAGSGRLAVYDRAFHGRFGKMAAFDSMMLRVARDLGAGDVGALIRRGIVGPRLVSAVLEQRVPALASLRVASALPLAPDVAFRVLRTATLRSFAPPYGAAPALAGGRR